MALRVAVASGNWSNPAIWNGGVLPNPGDVVASNNFTVTIDQNINVDTLTNAATGAGILTAQMTSNTTPSGIVTASSYYAGGYDPFLAFDRNPTGSGWLTQYISTGWIAYEFTSPTVVASYKVFPAGPGSPSSVARDWTFEGWNGSTYIVLDTVTGNSGTATVTRSIANTTAYIKYRLNITANNGNGNYTGTSELYLLEANDYGTTSTAGGGFILNGSNLTVSATGGGFVTGATRLLTYTGSNCVLNGNIIGSTTTAAIESLFHNSSGSLTINGDIVNTSTSPIITVIRTNSTGNLNITGNILSDSQGTNIDITSICTVTIIGNVTRGTSFRRGNLINITAGATVNITGDITQLSTANGNFIIVINSITSVVNITGNVVSNNNNGATAISPGQGTLNITGNVSYLTTGGANAISSSSNGYISIIGTILTSANGAAVSSTGAGAINLFSGPFVCSPYGFFPYQVIRMHLIPTTNSYFEFRDETTNGAVSPGAIAPATRLVSPATLVDNLAPSDVRFGTSYALGTLTGTLRMPVANQVTFGVQVDNTFGNAVLTADGIWNYLVSNLNTPDSIGMRLKNVSTPQTTGEQLEAFLRLD